MPLRVFEWSHFLEVAEELGNGPKNRIYAQQSPSGTLERAKITNRTSLLGLGFKNGLKLESRTPPKLIMQALRLPSTSLPTLWSARLNPSKRVQSKRQKL